MYTGRKVTQLTYYDVNTTPDGEETWEIENVVNLEDQVERYIEEAPEVDDPLSTVEIKRLRDFVTYLQNL